LRCRVVADAIRRKSDDMSKGTPKTCRLLHDQRGNRSDLLAHDAPELPRRGATGAVRPERLPGKAKIHNVSTVLGNAGRHGRYVTQDGAALSDLEAYIP
jgi:hypothetical protein